MLSVWGQLFMVLLLLELKIAYRIQCKIKQQTHYNRTIQSILPHTEINISQWNNGIFQHFISLKSLLYCSNHIQINKQTHVHKYALRLWGFSFCSSVKTMVELWIFCLHWFCDTWVFPLDIVLSNICVQLSCLWCCNVTLAIMYTNHKLIEQTFSKLADKTHLIFMLQNYALLLKKLSQTEFESLFLFNMLKFGMHRKKTLIKWHRYIKFCSLSCLVWIDRLKLFWLSFIFQLNFWMLFNVRSFIHWINLRNGFRLNVDHRWNDANNRRKPLERQRDKEGGYFFPFFLF